MNICYDSFQKCKKIAESKEEMAIAKPHVSDDEEDDRPFGGVALKENKGITFSLSVCMMHTVGCFYCTAGLLKKVCCDGGVGRGNAPDITNG